MATIREFVTKWGFQVDDRQIKLLDKQINKTQRNIAAMGKAAAAAGRSLTFGVTLPFGVASIAAVKLASDAEETRNKFLQVFKGFESQGAESVNRLKDEFKLAGSTAQDLLSTTGDLLKGLGVSGDEALRLSESVVALSSDVASFKNVQGGAERAASSLTKALLGERESLKLTFQTAVSEAEVLEEANKIRATRNDLSLRAAKALATLNIVQRRNTDAVGDFARTQGGVANRTRIVTQQMKDLAEQFGEILLPVAARLLQTFSDFLSFFQKLSPEIKTGILIVGALAAAIGPLLIVFGTLAQSIVAIRNAFLIMRLAGLKSIAVLALPLLKLIAIGALVGLVLEDIIAFFQGRKSVTGVIVSEFARAFEFLEGKFSEMPGFVQGLVAVLTTPFRALIATIKGVSGALGALVAGDFSLAKEALLGIGKETAQPLLDLAQGKQTSLSRTLGFGEQGALSQGIRSTRGVQALNGPTENVQTVNAPITVNVPPGTSPDAVAPVVEREFRKGMDRLAREINRQGQAAVVN